MLQYLQSRCFYNGTHPHTVYKYLSKRTLTFCLDISVSQFRDARSVGWLLAVLCEASEKVPNTKKKLRPLNL